MKQRELSLSRQLRKCKLYGSNYYVAQLTLHLHPHVFYKNVIIFNDDCACFNLNFKTGCLIIEVY